MKATLLAEAQAEVREAADWYADKSAALGGRFAAAFRAGLAEIEDAPMSHCEIEPGFRKCNLRHFPYSLVYRIHAAGIVVVAVMHQHREPGYWNGRN